MVTNHPLDYAMSRKRGLTMGVKIRERPMGVWWLFIDHKGRWKAVKVGTKSDQLATVLSDHRRIVLN